MEDVKNWYLRLTAKFFYDREIIEIENIAPEIKGEFFPSFVIHLYMKMLCYSVDRNGLIKIKNEYKADNNVSVMIANMFGFTSLQPSVKQALGILMNHGLVEIEEDFENFTTNIFLPEVVDNTGSTRLSSEQRQQRRIAAKQNKVLKLENKAIEKEEKNKEIKKYSYSHRRNVFLAKSEYKELSSYRNFKIVLNEYSIRKEILAIENDQYKSEDINDYEELKKILAPKEKDKNDMEF